MKRFDPKNLSIHNGYLRTKKKPREYCHRIIWEQDVGPIPTGYDIHHMDGNKLNNLLENLICITKADHMRLHAKETREKRSECMKKNSSRVHAWLKTNKGKKFLKDKALKEWDKKVEKTFICSICSREFKSKSPKKVKYCGDNCVMKARRLSGVDNEDRSCVICNKIFTINKYQKTLSCGPECRAKHIGNLKRKK
jgi:uncharacterized CHY-type Zn-finger protein